MSQKHLSRLVDNIEWNIAFQLNGDESKSYEFNCYAPTQMDAFGEFYISKGNMNVSFMHITKKEDKNKIRCDLCGDLDSKKTYQLYKGKMKSICKNRSKCTARIRNNVSK